MLKQKLVNRTIFTGDNLHVMRGMNSDIVDLIYLDPPFNSNKVYAAPVGSKAAGAAFRDTWSLSDIDEAYHFDLAKKNKAAYNIIKASRDTHGKSMMSYLIMMEIRLIELKRILKPTGSIYLHCDPTASHYLKILMDAIFDKENFQNELIWAYKGMPSKASKFQAKHDVILFYSGSSSKDRVFNVLRTDPDPGSLKTYKSGMSKGYNANYSRNMVTIFDMKKYQKAVASGKIPSGMRETMFKGGRPPMRSWWTDIKILGGPKNKERVGYPTQKPLKLLKRIIEASTNEGDLVLDPFCGCATTCVAAEHLNRRWIGIDISPKAYELVETRLDENTPEYSGVIHRTDVPKRTDLGNLAHPTFHKKSLYGEQEGFCNGCNTHFEIRHLEVDHIIPKDVGGHDHVSNLQLLCSHCNRVKGNRSNEYLMVKRAEVDRKMKKTF